MKPTEELLKIVFEQIYKPETDYLKLIEDSFDADYQQQVDGKTLNLDDFKKHIAYQRDIISDVQVEFEHIMIEDEKIFSCHRVFATKKDGSKIEARVFALFGFKDNKIAWCDELTHLVCGNNEDKNLGSAQ